MAGLNTDKAIKSGRKLIHIYGRYDVGITDMDFIRGIYFKDGLFAGLNSSFALGFFQGYKAARSEMKGANNR